MTTYELITLDTEITRMLDDYDDVIWGVNSVNWEGLIQAQREIRAELSKRAGTNPSRRPRRRPT